MPSPIIPACSITGLKDEGSNDGESNYEQKRGNLRRTDTDESNDWHDCEARLLRIQICCGGACVVFGRAQ